MSTPEEVDFETRRKELADEIARQRGHLTQAYLRLEKPIRYTEYGMRGFGFIRQNPWIVAAVPLVLNFAGSFFGGKKGSSQAVAESARPKGVLGKARHVAGIGVQRGWQLYQLYRRVRSLIP